MIPTHGIEQNDWQYFQHYIEHSTNKHKALGNIYKGLKDTIDILNNEVERNAFSFSMNNL